MSRLSRKEMEELKASKLNLEYPNLTARIADTVGKPIEYGISFLPKARGTTSVF